MTKDQTYQEFIAEFEKAMAGARNDEFDVRPLARAAGRHLKTRPVLPEIAPCLAAAYFAVFEFETGILKRAAVWLGIGYFKFIFRGRPMWNDFYMGLWQLSRCPFYVRRLHRHLTKANWQQLNTAAWMIRSVCQQDPEFKEQWAETERVHGIIDFEGAL